MRNALVPCGKNADVKVIQILLLHFARFKNSVSANVGDAAAAVAIKRTVVRACFVINTELLVTSACSREVYRQSLTCDWLL